MISEVGFEKHASEADNRALSLARAETVPRYLIEKGVPEHRLVAQGLGARRPASSNSTAGGRERNRRAELRLILGDTGSPSATQAPPL